MIVIYGTRFYGTVKAHGGQHQLTKFFHVYYLPIVPVGTIWVTREDDGHYRGHDVRMSGKSVVAGYARVWGPLAVVGAIAAGGAAGIAAAAGLAAVSAWSWTWRSLRSERERRRSDFHLLAFGTRCDPLDMEPALAGQLQDHVRAQWAEVAGGASPEDIARLGAANPAQAVLAYAQLRLAARLGPSAHAADAIAAGDRILDAVKDAPALDGGPYRGDVGHLPAGAEHVDDPGR